MKRSSLILALLALGALPVQAQDYFDALRRNFWLDRGAVCGLRSSNQSVALARVYAKADEGDFRKSYESPSVWEAGAEAYGMKHLPSFSLIGSFGFSQWTGEDMCGSMFAEPWRYPIDVLEFTPGRKSRQKYTMQGGFASDLGSSWRIGALAQFESSNYTKFKDLRYYNYTHDVRLLPGVQYLGDGWSAGATLHIGKSGETIQAEQIGDAANRYYVFLDKGLGRGVLEAWDADGVKLKCTTGGLPVSEYSFGGGLQASLGDFFISGCAEYLYTHAGEEQWKYFDAYGYRTAGEAAVRFAHSQLRLSASLLHQRNFEFIQEKRTNAGGITLLHTIGSNEIYLRQKGTCSLQYNYDSPFWTIEGILQYGSLRELGYLRAPFSYLSHIGTVGLDASALRHEGAWSFGGGFTAGTGFSSLHRYGSAVGTAEAPLLSADYFQADRTVGTATFAGLSATCEYRFGRGLYARASAYYTLAAALKHHRAGASLTFGYNF